MGLSGYLLVATALFFIGAAGFVARRNVLAMLLCLELMLNSVNLALIAFSRRWLALDGQVMALLVIAVAAAEAAIALAVVVLLFRKRASLDTDEFRAMRE